MTEADIGRLYALPLTDFIAERDRLAKAAAAGGDRAAAQRVKALRKPSTAAWAINQVAHTQPDLIDALLSATDEVRSAQARDAPALRAATAKRNEALQATSVAAAAALERAGHGSATQTDRIIRTLGVASSEDEHRDDLRAGQLVRELEPSGFEAFGVGPPSTEADAADAIDLADTGARRRAERLAADASTAERRVAQLLERAERLEQEALDAQRAARETRGEAEEARRAAEKARAAADEALENLD